MPGTITRAAYYRKPYTRADGTKVKGAKVPTSKITDRGKPGKGLKLIPKLKKGTLAKFGYTSKESDSKRHASLVKAKSSLSYKSVIDKLVAVRTLNKTTNPKVAAIFGSDIRWLQSKK